MKSFGIYTKNKDNKKTVSTVELHINIWKVKRIWRFKNIWENIRKKRHKRFIDFGLRIDATDIESIAFYIPFEVKKEEVEDLAECIVKDCNLLCTIFNADMSIYTHDTSSCIHYVTDIETLKDTELVDTKSEDTKSEDANKKGFWIYQLGATNLNIISNLEHGTLLEINLKPEFPDQKKIKPTIPLCEDCQKEQTIPSKNRDLYIRFRISTDKIAGLGCIEGLSNDWLQSAFTSTELIDFRINDLREIDKKIEEFITKNRNFSPTKFSKVHLFYMTNINETPIHGSERFLDSRILEENRWKSYLNQNEIKKRYISYHWRKKEKKEKGGFSTFNVFLKTEFSRLSFRRISQNLLFIAIIGTLINLLSSFLFNSCTK